MFLQIIRKTEIDRPAVKYILPLLFGACLCAGIAIAVEHKLSDRYAMEVDPAAKEMLGEKTFNEVMAFFHAAEKAIETKDLEAIMELYSEDYSNGGHDKKSVEQIWKRIFSTFEEMATHHNLKLVNVSGMKKEADRNTVVFSCSGLLMGIHDPAKGVITIDNWTQQDHVLIKEAGKWKLFGTYGRDRKRLWFDKPIHPLF
jgi:ketosteroid isomerase-like protein